MKLSHKSLEALKDRKLRLTLALDLKFTEVWVEKLIDQNKENGPLTTMKAVQIITRETNMVDAEILEETAEVEKA